VKIRTLICSLVLMLSAESHAGDVLPYQVLVEGEGRPVYLIPGLASPGLVWDDLATRLRAAGYQTRVLTLAGFAGQPPLPGDDFLPQVRSALAEELKSNAGAKPVVVGHSLGGFMAFWLAATVPDAIAAAVAVDGVPYLGALHDASATAETNRDQAEQVAGFMASLSAEQYASQNRMALQSMITDSGDIERMVEASSQTDPASVGRAMAELLTTDVRPLLSTIQVPVLLIQAADSGASEAGRESFARQVESVADIRHVVANRGRHFVQLDDPDFVASQVLALLDEVDHE